MPSSNARGSRRAFFQLWLPLLLIGSLLYNPFLVPAKHAAGLAYQTPARHRAGIGASEMQHFTPVQAEIVHRTAIFEGVFGGVVVENQESTSRATQKVYVPQRPELIASIWFRPPPLPSFCSPF